MHAEAEGNGKGGANIIFEGTARIDPAGPRADAVLAYIEKYREFIDSYGWTPESFAKDYPYKASYEMTPAKAMAALPKTATTSATPASRLPGRAWSVSPPP